jgi:hypothetical protein
MRPGNYMGDTNFSEQFLNFIMCKRSQTNSGVDLAPYSPDKLSENKKAFGEHWCRCRMGFVPSQYDAIQGTLVVKEK